MLAAGKASDVRPRAQAEILQTLSEVDKQGKYCVLMHKYFHFQDHFCIVTELLGPRLPAMGLLA